MRPRRQPSDILEPGRVVLSGVLTAGELVAPWVQVTLRPIGWALVRL